MSVRVPSYVKKYLRMKPEVTKIFEDLEEFHDWVRLQNPAVRFNEADLYRDKSPLWEKFQRQKNNRYHRGRPHTPYQSYVTPN
jgi:hypothetical protein